MRTDAIVMVVALTGVGLTGCALSRYPVMPPLSVTEATGLTCAQLAAEQASIALTERRISEIAETGRAADGSTPILWSNARSDADRAARARSAAVADAAQARGCPAG